MALAADIRPHIAEAALEYRAETAFGRSVMGGWRPGPRPVAGFLLSLWRLTPQFRARNVVERFTGVLLIAASSIAILTTAGIIFSLVFETYHFFELYPPRLFDKSLILKEYLLVE